MNSSQVAADTVAIIVVETMIGDQSFFLLLSGSFPHPTVRLSDSSVSQHLGKSCASGFLLPQNPPLLYESNAIDKKKQNKVQL